MKLTTVILPHVPMEFAASLEIVKPPFLHDRAVVPIQKYPGLCDVELTFSLPPDAQESPEEEKRFANTAHMTMLLALSIYYMKRPFHTALAVHYMLKEDAATKAYYDRLIAAGDDKDQALAGVAKKFLHDIIVEGGLLIGVDHRPCWDAGTCLHEEEGKD